MSNRILPSAPAPRPEAGELSLESHAVRLDKLTHEEVLDLVRELERHQLELEARNLELEEAKLALGKSVDALATSEERYRELYEAAPIGYLTLETGGRIQAANRAAAKLLGVEQPSLLALPLSRFVTPECQDAWHHYRRTLLRDGHMENVDLDLELGGGRRMHVQLAGMVLRNRDGDPIGLAIAILDLTERRRAERAVRESSRRMQIMTDALPVLVSYVDRDERYRFVSSGYETWFHESPERLRGRSVRDVLGEPGYNAIRDHIDAALSGKQTRFEQEMVYRDGTKRQVSISYTPDVDESGTVRGFFAVVQDLTELRRAERGLRAAAAEAALTEQRERRRLAADLHDDVAQLLSLASVKLRAIQDATSEYERAGLLAQLAVLVGECREHVTSLSFQLSPPVLHDLGLLAAARWLAEDFRRKYNLAVNLLATTQSLGFLDEPTRVTLFRALRELLINVARHSQTLEVRVEIGWEHDWASIRVEDSGLGFDPSAKLKGFGLVSLTERVEHMGGSVRIESTPGKGTQVLVRIPAPQSATRPEEEQGAEAAR
jgi:PAS domain S-box-containing protein